ncbi:MAG: glycosyltransferase [Limisphaerales bacterium]
MTNAPNNKPAVYMFGWPSFLGGADTKLAHLLILLHRHLRITVVPNDRHHLRNRVWTRFLDQLGVSYCMVQQLPKRLNGFALSLSNQRFFTDRVAHRAREKGLTIIWSSEMMWHHEGELEAIKERLIDKVLYVSEFQKNALSGNYGDLPSHLTGNYIDPRYFPFKERRNGTFAIGRLSRAAPEKYPEDFPVFYERLDLPEARFRVMAWDGALARKYRWHHFDRRWDLLAAEQETQLDFLRSLDLFVYPLGHHFKESWGRSTVEAMLTGCIPLVPTGHFFENLITHGESGFLCYDFLDYQEHAQKLYHDYSYRKQISAQCRAHARTTLCNQAQHLKTWLEVFR